MASFLHLDQAAKLVGKSEITLRRLLKTGKVTHRKEKTLTGFIYLLDPEELKRYYRIQTEPLPLGSSFAQPNLVDDVPVESAPTPALAKSVQVEVTKPAQSDQPPESAYWHQRAESLEDKYLQVLGEQAKIREELGLWRGRAEQAQQMVSALLPASTIVSTANQNTENKESISLSTWLVTILAIVAVLAVIGLGVAAYLTFS